MNNKDILDIAVRQSAWDLNAQPEDFFRDKYVIADWGLGEKARVYYSEPIAFNIVYYGKNNVASSRPEYKELLAEYIGRFEAYHLFEYPNMAWLNKRLEALGQSVCFFAEYWLPDLTRLRELPCEYEIRVLGKEDFKDLYKDEWSNDLCEKRKEYDVLAAGAYDGDRLVGLAGCSADCADMWQIGVDVLPEYRRQGIASALTSRLAIEILKRDKVPFYCCAWSNLKSVRNAIKSGFTPSWVEMTAKPAKIVDEINKDEK